MLAPAKMDFCHPYWKQIETERVYGHPGGGGGKDMSGIQAAWQFMFIARQALGTRIQGGFSHGDVIHFGGPVDEITWVVGFYASQLKARDQFEENGGQFAGGRDG